MIATDSTPTNVDITNCVWKPIHTQALCQLASEPVREVAQYDRALVYRFMQDESGWVIAESRRSDLEPFLDLHYPAADIPKQAARALHQELVAADNPSQLRGGVIAASART